MERVAKKESKQHKPANQPQKGRGRKRMAIPNEIEERIAHLDPPWRDFYRLVQERLLARWPATSESITGRKTE